MEHSERFGDLKSELLQAGVVRPKKERVGLSSETEQVQSLCKELSEGLKDSKDLKSIPRREVCTPEWSLIYNTPYNVSSSGANKRGLPTLCCLATHEASPKVLKPRKKLLRLRNAMDLRMTLWLDVNLWLTWNPSGLGTGEIPQFTYADGLPDEVAVSSEPYTGEKAKKIQQLYHEDFKRMGELGDFLTSCPALCNNPDSPAKDRVVSSQIKEAIDHMLAVSKHSRLTVEAIAYRCILQTARVRMDRQRYLTCPPDEGSDGKANPFERLPDYTYSQATFKRFTPDEVRRQAGKEVLPKEGICKAGFESEDVPQNTSPKRPTVDEEHRKRPQSESEEDEYHLHAADGEANRETQPEDDGRSTVLSSRKRSALSPPRSV